MSEWIVYAETVDDLVDGMCSIVDKIVRCEDCKHWYSDADVGMACEFTNLGQPKDGFCNWGDRRSE